MIRPELLAELKRLDRNEKLEIIQYLNDALYLDGGVSIEQAADESIAGASISTSPRRPKLSIEEEILNQMKVFDLLANTQSHAQKELHRLDDPRQKRQDKGIERQRQFFQLVHAELSAQQANLEERIETSRLTATQLTEVRRYVTLFNTILERHVKLSKDRLDLRGEGSKSARKYIDVERETLTRIAEDLVERRLSNELPEDHIEHTESFLANISKNFDFGVQPVQRDLANVVQGATESSEDGQHVADAPSLIELDKESIFAEARNVVALVSAEVNRAQEIRDKHSEAQLSDEERAILKRSKVMQAILVEARKLAQQIETLDPKDLDRLDELGYRLGIFETTARCQAHRSASDISKVETNFSKEFTRLLNNDSMPDVQLQENVPLAPQDAFDTFVEQMDIWWPRQGVFPYSFAPKSTFPRHIRFEAQLNGRYYETFADDSEYEIGRITVWEPPATLCYTWQDPTWPSHNQITLRFTSDGEGTLVTYEQDGFAEAGVPELVPYYQIGCGQTLSAYIAHCRAIFELQGLGP